jgi:aspartate-semialdehyde dehydrogenase
MSESAGRPLTVAVVGATGSVGRDLVSTLDRSSLPIDGWRLIATRGTRTPRMEVGDADLPVHALPADSGGSPLWEGVDLAVLACPPEVARAHAPALLERDVPVVDLSGGLADRAPIAVPAAGATGLDGFGDARAIVSPSPGAVLLATLLHPLRELGATAARGTLLLSAGHAGRDGVEELSGQVVSLFNQGEPPRKVFPTGLAFDLLPQAGPATDGWLEVERRVAAEVEAVLSPPAPALALTSIVAPTFTGVSVALHVDFGHAPPMEAIRQVFGVMPTLQLADPAPGPRRLAGKPRAVVGRLRLDPSGEGLHLWASADNLRFGASGNALAIALGLYREGWL